MFFSLLLMFETIKKKLAFVLNTNQELMAQRLECVF